MSRCRIRNLTRNAVLAEQGELADNPWLRLKGLLGRNALERGQALVIRPCRGVHTWFMAFPIDVLHVDSGSLVCGVVAGMLPNRLGPVVWRSEYAVELPAGVVRASGTQVGDRLELT